MGLKKAKGDHTFIGVLILTAIIVVIGTAYKTGMTGVMKLAMNKVTDAVTNMFDAMSLS